MEPLVSGIGSRFLCTFIPLSIIGLCVEMVRVGSPKGWNAGWKILAIAGVVDIVAIFVVPEAASMGAALVYMFAALSGMGVGLTVWGVKRAVFARRRCTARVTAVVTGSRTVHVGRSTTPLFTATFDYQGRTYEADELNGAVTRAVAGYLPPEPSGGPTGQERAKDGRKHLAVGDSCTLLVNPGNPAEAMYANEHNVAAGVVSALIGTVMAAFCVFGLVYMAIITIGAIS